MEKDVAVALFGMIVSIITVIAESKKTRTEVNNKLEINQAVMQNEIEHLKKDNETIKTDIKEHNHYAKLFSETVPVIQEQMKVVNHRLSDLERTAH